MNDIDTTTIVIQEFLAFTIGIVVFFVGANLTRNIAFLRNYNIPEPVSGGLAVALATWASYSWFGIEIEFDLATRDELLVIFFATIGLNARLTDLFAGGRMLLLLLVMTVSFIFLQNTIGLFGSYVFQLPSSIGVLMGSASLIGGHGTAIAWGPTIETETGFAAANEIGIAFATMGLVIAALIGGPIAKYLIDRNNLESSAREAPVVGLPFESDVQGEGINHVNLMHALLAANIAIIMGYIANGFISDLGIKLPLFVPCLLMAILLSNTIPLLFPKIPWPSRSRSLAVISDYSLSIFLSMSLMSMKLWTLSGFGGPLLFVLFLQVALTVIVILFVFFRVMGSDYTSAVLSAGFAGFTLGATPTAIANMSSVSKRYGPAPLAFIILPIVSAFFVDLANAFIIRYFSAL